MSQGEFHMEESDSDDDWDETSEDAASQVTTVCLFCPEICSVSSVWSHIKSEHSVDIAQLKVKHGMDCFSYIKLVNWIRQKQPLPDEVLALSSQKWESDDYLKPTIQDDLILTFDFDGIESQENSCPAAKYDYHIVNSEGDSVTLSSRHYQELQQKLQLLERDVKEKQDIIVALQQDIGRMRGVTQSLVVSEDIEAAAAPTRVKSIRLEEDQGYFSSYSNVGIHHEMLSDHVRTESYREAILENRPLFDDKVVLDLGCGTSILSMFAAKAGARHVIGIDQSEIIYLGMDIVRENELENQIQLIRGRLEDTNLPVLKVDIIVSEWMGYFLLFEGMLDSVVYARDRYLRPGGKILPDHCSISVVGVCDMEKYKSLVSYWDDVYGFKMSCLKSEVVKEATVDTIPANCCITEPCLVRSFNLTTCSANDVEFSTDFTLTFTRDGFLTSVAGYFDTSFNLDHPVHFSTGPHAPPTHWKQTVFHIPNPPKVTKGSTIQGNIRCQRQTNDVRNLKVVLNLNKEMYNYNVD